MHLTETLTQAFDTSPFDQRQVAALTWLEQWNNQSGEALKPGTVISRFSEVLSGKIKGIRFFFAMERERAELLLEVLQVPADQRDAVLEAAKQALDTGGATIYEAVFDLTDVDEAEVDSFVEAFRKLELYLLDAPERALLLLTQAQHDELPNRVNRYTHVDIHTVASATEGEDRARQEVERRGLFVGARSLVPLERWIAMEWDGYDWQFDPPETFSRARRGHLFDVPDIDVPLEEGPDEVEDAPWFAPPDGPVERRRMLVQLRDPDRADQMGGPALRRHAAKVIGGQAVASRRDRWQTRVKEAEAEFGLVAQQSTEEAVATLLDRARRRPVAPTLLHTPETPILHIINAGTAAEAHRGEGVEVHEVEGSIPALLTLREHCKDWTEDDMVRDRTLARAVDALGSDADDRGDLLHARATMLACGELVSGNDPMDPAEGAWREGLRKILSAKPPAARLRVVMPEGEADKPRFLRVAGDPELPASGCGLFDEVRGPGLAEVARGEQISIDGRESASSSWSRSHQGWFARFHERRGYNAGYDVLVGDHGYASHALADALIPVQSPDLDRWIDLAEASRALGGSPERAAEVLSELGMGHDRLYRHKGSHTSGPFQSPPGRTPWSELHRIEIPAATWAEADRVVGFAWVALRQALLSGAPTTVLHDGTALLSVGSGVYAEIRAYRAAEDGEAPRAAVRAPIRRELDGLEPLTVDHETHRAQTARERGATYHSSFSVVLPRALHLAGGGWRATVRFSVSPFEVGAMPLRWDGAVAAADEDEIEAEEARRRLDDEWD